MRVEYRTLADLDLLGVNDRSGELFQFLDHSVTAGGRAALQQLFFEPLSLGRDIRHRQQILQHLIPSIASLDLRDLGSVVGRVEKYIGSSFLPLPDYVIQRWLLKIRYADMVDHITEGIHALGELLQFAQAIGDVLETFPVELVEAHRLASSIRECLEMPVHIQLDAVLRKSTYHPSKLGRFDALIRDRTQVRDKIRSLIGALYHFDALRSLAIASSKPGWSFPVLLDEEASVFQAEGLTHPLLPNAVPNAITLVDPYALLYVTGPNMAGKTTFMKACAVSVLFSHIGMAVPATSLRLSLFDRMYAALSVHDSIMMGESFFLAEVRRIKTLAEHAARGERVFAVIDEMFKGTNVLDASEATRLVVSGLSKVQGSVYLVASHITDFVSDLENSPEISFAFFDVQFTDAGHEFTYQIKPGVSTCRLGLELLRQEGVLRLLEDAQSV